MGRPAREEKAASEGKKEKVGWRETMLDSGQTTGVTTRRGVEGEAKEKPYTKAVSVGRDRLVSGSTKGKQHVGKDDRVASASRKEDGVVGIEDGEIRQRSVGEEVEVAHRGGDDARPDRSRTSTGPTARQTRARRQWRRCRRFQQPNSVGS
ncbi:hypothetical protein E2562_031719 [Oryza meyeriana var. granulata]|uniref:Uncharacterized protein n=1 Tax=Oryza meyeriana var. granulata TaxID=110450 RepID=A0A6G1FE91_9ORYZ|nr:hypothetical protein E2562_031719 [Oryza meyeriana var. granulata]